ncbi:acyltransferase [Sphingomonas donggukensis]|uniref:Acyltransferase n=1 Tax=Sphingomonas donggukensis TaxID=2949093 RepID=A0ABY4TSS2_9SPHN|nr:acyltransferase [Sphingomonas donggukensis]URW74457.1 acyltransferase [Sphingomonas donggukensis]
MTIESMPNSPGDGVVDPTAALNMPRSTRFYPALETCRGICALMVAVMHIPWDWSFRSAPLVRHSWLFVDFFFVLSGFVIANAFIERMRDRAAVATFARRRFFRLYPLHIVTTLATLALIGVRYVMEPASTIETMKINADWWWLAASNVFLVHAWGVSGDAVLNTASWSISTEVAAYIAFGLICSLVATPGRRVLAHLALGIASAAVLLLFRHDVGLGGDVTLRVFRCTYSFALGVGIWWLVRKREIGGKGEVSSAVQVMASAVVIAMVIVVGGYGVSTMLIPFAFAAAILALAGGPDSFVSRCLSIGPLLWLGTLSYSVYLTHALVQTVFDVARKRAMGSIDLTTETWIGDALVLVSTFAVLLVSAVTYRWIEAPWRDFGKTQRLSARGDLGVAAAS